MLIYSHHDPRFYDRRLHKGGSSTTTEGARTTTTNTDRRVAVQDGVAVTGEGASYSTSSSLWMQDASDRSTWMQDNSDRSTYFQDNSNSSDAVVAMASMGADVIKASGGAVVDLYKNAGAQNADTWNTTIMQGARLVDKLIDKAAAENSLASKVVDSFTPNENKNAENIKYAAIAAGVIGAAALWSKKS